MSLAIAAVLMRQLSDSTKMWFGAPFWFGLSVLMVVVVVVGLWKMFVKAGQPGWACLIPFYNLYVVLKIAGRPGWWLPLMFIPLVNLVIQIIVAIDIAKAFGQAAGFGFFLNFLLGGIGYVILGFGNYQYLGPQAREMETWQAALLAGAGAAVLSFLPVLSFGCFIWLFGAGVWTVAMHQRRVPTPPVTPGMGMRIGALAGAFAFIIIAITATVLFAIEGEQVRKVMEERLEELPQFIAPLNTPGGLATMFLSVLVVLAVIFLAFSAVGGALTAAFSARRRGVP